jgi:hypothetical protein
MISKRIYIVKSRTKALSYGVKGNRWGRELCCSQEISQTYSLFSAHPKSPELQGGYRLSERKILRIAYYFKYAHQRGREVMEELRERKPELFES